MFLLVDWKLPFCIFFPGVGLFFARFVFFGDVWIRTQRAAVALQVCYQLSYPFHPCFLLSVKAKLKILLKFRESEIKIIFYQMSTFFTLLI
jgi:hypothetical protein